MKKIPIIGYRITLSDIIAGSTGFFSSGSKEKFHNILSAFHLSEHAYFINSGISALYIILQALRQNSSKREVILPAYTAPSIIVAVKKTGLKPILCDISLQDFNMEIETLHESVTQDTLAVVCVHSFGIPVRNVELLKNTLPDDVFLIEDCAQAMGSKISDRLTGSFGDAAIFSLNRGKNLPTYGGGVISTNSHDLSDEIAKTVQHLNEPGLIHEVSLFLKFIALSAVFRPFFFTLLYPLMARFKEDSIPTDFKVTGYTLLQAALGSALFRQFDDSCKKRFENGMKIIHGLKTTEGVILPGINETVKPAFNRFPLIVDNLERKKKIESALRRRGIESSSMYIKPLHQHFDLGYGNSDFQKASYFADHMLTLPVHPLLTDDDINKIINTIAETK